MVATIAALVILSLFYVLGYRVDLRQHTVEQTGVVQFLTTPADGTVEIDGKVLSTRTPTKETVSPGLHEFVMWREGYETWRKTLDIPSGTLTWLNYTRLIPKQRTIEAVQQIGNPASNIVSLDHRFMALLPDASKPGVTIFDLTRETLAPAQTYNLAADTYSDSAQAAGHQFALVQWDNAGRFMLVRHQFGSTVEWLVFDRQSGKVRSNISQTMDIAIQDIVIMDGSGDRYLALTDGDVRKIDLSSETLSKPLVSDVSSFSFDPTSGTVAYVEIADPATGYRKVGVVKKDGKPVTMYRSDAGVDVPLSIKTAHYFGKDYVTIVEGKKIALYSGDFPDNENDTMKRYARFTIPNNLTALHVSPSGRFVVAQSGNQFVGYDIERKKVSDVAELPEGTSALRWLDDYILYYEHKGTLTVREFDGANIHNLKTVTPGFMVTLSQNGKYLYSVGAGDNGQLRLQRLKMILD